MLWFNDLTVMDPTYALPVIASGILVLSAQLNVADGMQGQPPDTIRNIKLAMIGLAVIMVPLMGSFPAVSHTPHGNDDQQVDRCMLSSASFMSPLRGP